MKRLILAIALLTTMVTASSIVFAVPVSPREFSPVQDGFNPNGQSVLPYAPDRILVQFTAKAMNQAKLDLPLAKGASTATATTGLASVDAILKEFGVTTIERTFGQMADKASAEELGVYRSFTLRVPEGTDIPAAARRLAADPNLAYAEPDMKAFPATVPDDPQYSDNWGHNNTAQLPAYGWGTTWDHTGAGVGTVGFDTNAELAWNAPTGYGSSSAIVAILDSGVDTGHPDLNLMTGYDFGDSDNNPMDDSAQPGHGTACAGVAAAVANNTLGVTGIGGGVTIMPLKVADSAGSMYFSYIANALYYAADNGADVASMSFGAATSSSSTTDPALQYAFNNGVTLFAATGNENVSTISYPAINQYVIGVGAASPCGDRKRSSSNTNDLNPGVSADPNSYTCDGERWWGSNYGSTLQDNSGAVDIIAPTILPTTDISGSGGYQSGDYEPFFNGTSCATPYAAGVAALVKSANPSWSPTQVRDQLTGTATDIVNVESGSGWDRYSGYGMVDAEAAVGGGPTAPVANFTSDITNGCAPQTVNFTDTSTGTVSSWAWDFGDGQTSTAQHPTNVYIFAGTYTVTLTVTGPVGSDSLTMTDMITIEQTPTAEFSGDVLSGQLPLTVNFTDLSTGNPTIWSWFFGDGATDSQQNPSHTYTAAGDYAVILIAENGCGQNLMTKSAYIHVTAPQPPVASFSGTPTNGCAPLDVVFTDSSTGDITSWAWDFGDGGTSTLQNPSYNYANPGSYDVTLTVTGPGGNDVSSQPSYITVGAAPVAAFTATPTTGTAPVSVTFSDQSTGSPTAWAWDFGDGNTDTVQNPTHTYSTGGSFTASLIATNSCGSDTTSQVITIDTPLAPVADFSADLTSGCGPLDVVFTDLSTGNITSWAWDFGDGGTSTLQNPSYNYANPGSYDVTLTVTGPGGNSINSKPGYITVGAAPVAAFTATPTTGTAPVSVSFSDQSTENPATWAWDFGDGNTDTVQNPNHTYSAAGNFTAVLIATNSCGSDTTSQVITINAPLAPVADFSADLTSGCEPLDVSFTDLSTGDITSWAWDFGEGSPDSTQNPVHHYANYGTYDVTLTVSGPGGNSVMTKPGYIVVGGPPVAAFSASDTTGTAPLAVTFTDATTGPVITWGWDFGDGAVDSVQNPAHTFTTAGTYNVTLIAATACAADTSSLQIQVNPIAGPTAAFSATPTSGCAPVIVNFTDQSTGDITDWNWDFGDATGDTTQNPSHTYNVAGSYDVRLIVFGPGGADTLLTPAAVTVDSLVTAAFSADAVEGANPFTVNFSDESTGGPTSWLWDFGDGVTDTLQSPSHTYTTEGVFDVALTATGPCGADTVIMTGLIIVHTPSGVGDVVNARFHLSQNFPNPFNPTTTIVFSLAKQGYARLEVYDASGRRLSTLVNEQMAAGEHRITWQPFNLASGVYFSRLTADGKTATQRMVLIR